MREKREQEEKSEAPKRNMKRRVIHVRERVIHTRERVIRMRENLIV